MHTLVSLVKDKMKRRDAYETVHVEDVVAIVDGNRISTCEPYGKVLCPRIERADPQGREDNGLLDMITHESSPEPACCYVHVLGLE